MKRQNKPYNGQKSKLRRKGQIQAMERQMLLL